MLIDDCPEAALWAQAFAGMVRVWGEEGSFQGDL